MQAQGLDEYLEQSRVAIVCHGFVNIAESKRKEKKKKKHPRNESCRFNAYTLYLTRSFQKLTHEIPIYVSDNQQERKR